MYERERKELYNIITSKINVQLSHIPTHEEKIQEIFYSEDLGTLNALGKFIKTALQKRESMICHKTSTGYWKIEMNSKMSMKMI